jgi:hypothetical protein
VNQHGVGIQCSLWGDLDVNRGRSGSV